MSWLQKAEKGMSKAEEWKKKGEQKYKQAEKTYTRGEKLVSRGLDIVLGKPKKAKKKTSVRTPSGTTSKRIGDCTCKCPKKKRR